MAEASLFLIDQENHTPYFKHYFFKKRKKQLSLDVASRSHSSTLAHDTFAGRDVHGDALFFLVEKASKASRRQGNNEIEMQHLRCLIITCRCGNENPIEWLILPAESFTKSGSKSKKKVY